MMAKKNKIEEMKQPPVNKLTEQIKNPQTKVPATAPKAPEAPKQATAPIVFTDPVTGVPNAIQTPQGDFLTGLRPDQIRAMARVYAGQQEIPQGAISGNELAAQQQAAAGKEELQKQQQALLSSQAPQVNPLAPQLTPIQQIGQNVPLLQSAVEQTAGILRQQTFGRIPKKYADELAAKQAENPNLLRGLILTDIQKTQEERGIKLKDRWGAVIENIPALPYIGNVKRYIGNPNTPSDTVKDLQNQIADSQAYVISVRKSAAAGAMDSIEAYNLIEAQERQLTVAEQKIKIAIMNSEQLRTEPETIRAIETDILTTRQMMLSSKAVALGGINKNPTSEELLAELEGLY